MPRKRQALRLKSSVRLSADEANQADRAASKLGFSSRNDYFLWLHRKHVEHENTLEEQVKGMVEQFVNELEGHLDRRLQRINTAAQINVALLDSFIKYVVSALPDIPESLHDVAVSRGERLYQKIALAAMREFRARRVKKAYDPERFDEGPSDSGALLENKKPS